jgi:hypothetical protein
VSLAAAAAEFDQKRSCKAGQVIESLDEADRATMALWIDENRSATWMQNVFRKAGYTVHRDTLRLHLIGNCACPEETVLRGVPTWRA